LKQLSLGVQLLVAIAIIVVLVLIAINGEDVGV